MLIFTVGRQRAVHGRPLARARVPRLTCAMLSSRVSSVSVSLGDSLAGRLSRALTVIVFMLLCIRWITAANLWDIVDSGEYLVANYADQWSKFQSGALLLANVIVFVGNDMLTPHIWPWIAVYNFWVIVLSCIPSSENVNGALFIRFVQLEELLWEHFLKIHEETVSISNRFHSIRSLTLSLSKLI